MRATVQRRRIQDPDSILERLESFLEASRQPAVLEPGDEPIALEPANHALSKQGRGCLLEVWGPAGSLTRRIAAITAASRDKLELQVKRFGGRETELHLVDLDRQSARFEARQNVRQFAKTLEKLLAQCLPGAGLERLQTGADLERSLSPLYPRGVVVVDGRRWALLACPPAAGAAAADGALAFGLIWLDAVRREAMRRRATAGLILCLPSAHTAVTAARLTCLERQAASFRLFAIDNVGMREIDPADHGNLDSHLPVCTPPAQPQGEAAELFQEILKQEAISYSARPDGTLTLDVRGLTVGEASHDRLTFGMVRQKPLGWGNLGEALRLIDETAAARSPDAPDRNHRLFTIYPEQWIESKIRTNPCALDPTLRAEPWYQRVPATLGADRGVLDMLGIDRNGRLVILELKAEEELRLPIQALDYWMRVERHRRRGDFERKGYFRGAAIADQPARLILVAPALKFHPKTGSLLRYFPQSLPVERIGLTADWRHEIHAIYRQEGVSRAEQES